MKKTLKLQFKDNLGATRIISVDNPKPGLTKEEVNQAMDEIINSSSLATKNGKVTSKVKAYIQSVDTEEIEII